MTIDRVIYWVQPYSSSSLWEQLCPLQATRAACDADEGGQQSSSGQVGWRPLDVPSCTLPPGRPRQESTSCTSLRAASAGYCMDQHKWLSWKRLLALAPGRRYLGLGPGGHRLRRGNAPQRPGSSRPGGSGTGRGAPASAFPPVPPAAPTNFAGAAGRLRRRGRAGRCRPQPSAGRGGGDPGTKRGTGARRQRGPQPSRGRGVARAERGGGEVRRGQAGGSEGAGRGSEPPPLAACNKSLELSPRGRASPGAPDGYSPAGSAPPRVARPRVRAGSGAGLSPGTWRPAPACGGRRSRSAAAAGNPSRSLGSRKNSEGNVTLS